MRLLNKLLKVSMRNTIISMNEKLQYRICPLICLRQYVKFIQHKLNVFRTISVAFIIYNNILKNINFPFFNANLKALVSRKGVFCGYCAFTFLSTTDRLIIMTLQQNLLKILLSVSKEMQFLSRRGSIFHALHSGACEPGTGNNIKLRFETVVRGSDVWCSFWDKEKRVNFFKVCYYCGVHVIRTH